MVNSEMGRKPKIGDPRSGGVSGQGRDHWTHAQSILLAGGGIRGGQTYGTSDKQAGFPIDKPVSPEQMSATIFHALGIDPHMRINDRQGRPVELVHNADPVFELFS